MISLTWGARQVRSNPFITNDHLTLAQVDERALLLMKLKTSRLSPITMARLDWLNARARPPRYDIVPKGAT